MDPFKDSVLLRLEVPYLHVSFPLAYFPSKAKVNRISPISMEYTRILQLMKESIRDRDEGSCHSLSMVGLAGSNLMRKSEPMKSSGGMNHFSMDNDPENAAFALCARGSYRFKTKIPLVAFSTPVASCYHTPRLFPGARVQSKCLAGVCRW